MMSFNPDLNETQAVWECLTGLGTLEGASPLLNPDQGFSIFSEPHSFPDRDLYPFVEMMRLTNGGTVFPVPEGMITVTDTAILSEPVIAATTASANKTWACCLAHPFLL